MEKLTYLQKYRKTVTLVDYSEFLNKGLNSLPELWKSFFTSNNEETITKNILYFWKQQIGKKLNNVIAYFEDNLVKVEIIKTNNEFSLLYSIKQENGGILYYEGKFPQTKFNNYKLEKQWYKIPVSIKDFYKNLRVTGEFTAMNNELEKAARVADFIELADLMAHDALDRNESCGGHLRVESMTAEGEAKRDDEHFKYVSVWEYKGEDKAPELHKEELVFENIQLTQRSYK